MKNNIHRLTEDWRMYFCGTFIFAAIEGQYRVMQVDDVLRSGDDTQLEGMDFVGTIWDTEGNMSNGRWGAASREEFRPISGYYQLGQDPNVKAWVTFNVPNRTQKKGVDTRNVLLNNMPGCSPERLLKIFIQSQEYVSKPGNRDFHVKTNGRVFWKGLEVGNMVDGAFVASELHKNKEAVLWRLLQTI